MRTPDAVYKELLQRILTLERRIVLVGGGGGAPAAHATSHQSGGSDPIKLDDLAAPDDNTDLNASTSAHGLLRKLSNVSTEFLNGQGNWATPSGSGAVTMIEEQTPSGTGTLTFSSLGAYRHLEIRWSARSDKAAVNAEDLTIRFNGDTGSNYDSELLYNSTGTAAAAFEAIGGSSGIIGLLPAATATASRSGSGTIRINDYRGTTFHKSIEADVHSATTTTTGTIVTRLFGVTWRDASAVTSITLFLGTGNFVSGSKFTLYGYN